MNCPILQHTALFSEKVCAPAAAGYSYSADIIDCHQVMEMTVISSTPSALLIETICSVNEINENT